MPPPKSGKQLTARQIAMLDKWIEQGAPYDLHWAFKKPQQAPLPAVKQQDWPRNAIDHFVLARLEAEGLAPSPRGRSYTLVRRLYLDLIGLPPTPGGGRCLRRRPRRRTPTRSSSTACWPRRTTASAGRAAGSTWPATPTPTATRRTARARIWPYRDWVIKALNDDMPFDQFTIEQLAGDLLPDATREQRIATGFHRNTMLNEEGGIDPLEFRFWRMVDRVNTTGTTWLGLTVACRSV